MEYSIAEANQKTTHGSATFTSLRFDQFFHVLIFEEMQDEFRRFWTEPWSFLSCRPLLRMLKAPTSWVPRADIYEKNDQLVVKIDLPGMKKEDTQVSLDNGDLVVRGESKAESEVKEEDYVLSPPDASV